jgi:UDP-glucose 4-epimerase
MHVVVVGATGNVGTSLVQALAGDPDIGTITGIARRRAVAAIPKVSWVAADVCGNRDELTRCFDGADAVVHLAWLIQPSRDTTATHAVNVDGSVAVFQSAADAGVPSLIYASSVGAYSEGPKDHAVDESWPTEGIPTSFYSRHKAEVETILDDFEIRHPDMRVVRMRPGLIFKREAATEIRRLFFGPFLPNPLLREALIPFVPAIDRLRFQAVHTDDVAEAYRLAIKSAVHGAFNVAADPILDPPTLADLLGARLVRVPPGALRGAAALTWRLRLQPTPAGWLDMGLGVPIMDTARVRSELGWEPRRTATESLAELLEGIREGRGYPTPPLDPSSSGRLRMHELRTGVGARTP